MIKHPGYGFEYVKSWPTSLHLQWQNANHPDTTNPVSVYCMRHDVPNTTLWAA